MCSSDLEAFLDHPVTGVGAGQFKHYKPEGRLERWRESHNAWLQVAAEMGVAGLVIFSFLVFRGVYAPSQTRSLLKRLRRGRARRGAITEDSLPPGEREMLDFHAAAMSAAFAGWFACAIFGSVAYNWTLYYLLGLAIGPREYLQDRLALTRPARRTAMPAAAAVEARA